MLDEKYFSHDLNEAMLDQTQTRNPIRTLNAENAARKMF